MGNHSSKSHDANSFMNNCWITILYLSAQGTKEIINSDFHYCEPKILIHLAFCLQVSPLFIHPFCYSVTHMCYPHSLRLCILEDTCRGLCPWVLYSSLGRQGTLTPSQRVPFFHTPGGMGGPDLQVTRRQHSGRGQIYQEKPRECRDGAQRTGSVTPANCRVKLGSQAMPVLMGGRAS